MFLTYSCQYSTYNSTQHLHVYISISLLQVQSFSAGGVRLTWSLLFSQLPLLGEALYAGPQHLSSVYGLVRSGFGLVWGHSPS